MGDVIKFERRRVEKDEEGTFCLSIVLTSDGKVTLELDQDEISTRAQAAWALSQIALAIGDIVQYKRELPDGCGEEA